MTAHQAKPLRTLARMQLPLMLAVAAILFVALPADPVDHQCGAPAAIERGDKLRYCAYGRAAIRMTMALLNAP
jgi:hypothetical protein